MKKKLLFTLMIPMVLGFASGCNTINGNSGMKLTYGTYITSEDYKLTDAKEIDFADLTLRMGEDGQYHNENFLLVIAPTNGCICWANFQPVLKTFIKETNYLVYQMKVTDFGDENYSLVYKQGYVSLNIVKAGKVIKHYLSGNNNIFTSSDALKAEVNKYVRAPEIFWVNEDQLDTSIKHGENVLAIYAKTSCSDCNYAFPKALWPFVEKNKLKAKAIIYDMDEIAETLSADDYQEFKDVHYLSNKLDENFGYGKGVVPTIHYYERGVLVDATVFFNDKVELVGDEYKVTSSFYSQERLNSISYAQDIKTPVLEGLTIPQADLYEGTTFWKHEKAYEYHKPLFDSFMKIHAI